MQKTEPTETGVTLQLVLTSCTCFISERASYKTFLYKRHKNEKKNETPIVSEKVMGWMSKEKEWAQKQVMMERGNHVSAYLSDGTWQHCGRSERGSWAERGASWPPQKEQPSQLP